MFRRLDITKCSVERAKETLDRFRKGQLEQALPNVNLHIRADAHIPTTFPFEKLQVSDSLIKTDRKVSDKNGFIPTLLLNYDRYIDVLKNKNVWYSIKTGDRKSYLLLFFGTEADVYKRVLIRAAKAVDWVPKIDNGIIVGNIDLKVIIDVTFKYNRDYGMMLKDMYDKGKYLGSGIPIRTQ